MGNQPRTLVRVRLTVEFFAEVPDADREPRALCDLDHGLTQWEQDFAEALHRWVFDQRRPLTERQRAKLDAILERFGK